MTLRELENYGYKELPLINVEKMYDYYVENYSGMKYTGNLGVELLDNIINYGFEHWDENSMDLFYFFDNMLPDFENNLELFIEE